MPTGKRLRGGGSCASVTKAQREGIATLLILDDDAAIADLVRVLLEDAGHQAVVAPALDDLATSHGVDCVVADFIPLKTYSVAAARIWIARVRDRFPGRPVVLVTAHTEALRDRVALGITYLVLKPFDVDVLLATVDAALRA